MTTDLDALIADLGEVAGSPYTLPGNADVIEAGIRALEQSQAELRQERERAENGSCWDDGPQMRTPGGCDPMPPRCELRAGHLGAHRGGGAEWMRNPASFNQVSKERDEAQAALSRAEETIDRIGKMAREDDAGAWNMHQPLIVKLTEYGKQKGAR